MVQFPLLSFKKYNIIDLIIFLVCIYSFPPVPNTEWPHTSVVEVFLLEGIIFIFKTSEDLFLENVRQEHQTFFPMCHMPCDWIPSSCPRQGGGNAVFLPEHLRYSFHTSCGNLCHLSTENTVKISSFFRGVNNISMENYTNTVVGKQWVS